MQFATCRKSFARIARDGDSGHQDDRLPSPGWFGAAARLQVQATNGDGLSDQLGMADAVMPR